MVKATVTKKYVHGIIALAAMVFAVLANTAAALLLSAADQPHAGCIAGAYRADDGDALVS
jgi:hypothetical protein